MYRVNLFQSMCRGLVVPLQTRMMSHKPKWGASIESASLTTRGQVAHKSQIAQDVFLLQTASFHTSARANAKQFSADVSDSVLITDAYRLFKDGAYLRAQEKYSILHDKMPNNCVIKARLAFCLSKTGDVSDGLRAAILITQAKEMSKGLIPEVNNYLALILA